MHTALKAALEKDELFALYQPQLTADGAKVVSAEALLRWSRPGVGTVLPDDFVPYAETNKLIEALGMFILGHACRTAADWGDLPVSINVSPLQFSNGDLAKLILTTAEEANLPLHRLEIEITETASFADIPAACRTIQELRARGVSVSLDDLGDGHATIFLMQELPLDRVKLGKNLIDLASTKDGGNRLTDLVRLARDLDLGVTAEGVETQEQLTFVRNCGCDRIQGYLFARPMSGAEVTAFSRLVSG